MLYGDGVKNKGGFWDGQGLPLDETGGDLKCDASTSKFGGGHGRR